MKSKKKKSQVDVALTIGSIIIPVAALFGALIFAFVMISQYADAAKYAALISYDTVTLADVAYSVPDTIKVYYQPPSGCEFIKSTDGKATTGISCLNDFMNLTQFQLKTNAYSTEMSDGCADVPYSLNSYLIARFPADVVIAKNGKKIPEPYYISYPGYTDLKDQSVAMSGRAGAISLTLDNAIIVQKTRTNMFDTLDTSITFNTKDPLFSVIDNMREACTSALNGIQQETDSQQFIIPHNYNLSVKGSTLYLMKLSQSPFDITDKKDANWTVVYSFDTSTLNKYCTFDISGVAAPKKTNGDSAGKYYTEAKGNNAVAETKVTCANEDCNTDPGCQCSTGDNLCMDCSIVYPDGPIFKTTTKMVIQ